MQVIVSIIVDKSIINKKSEAIKMVREINSSFSSTRETSDYFKFRFSPITSVVSESVTSVNKNNGITIVYGTLKSKKTRSHYGTRRYSP